MIPCDKFLSISLYSLGKVSRSQWWRRLDTNAIFLIQFAKWKSYHHYHIEKRCLRVRLVLDDDRNDSLRSVFQHILPILRQIFSFAIMKKAQYKYNGMSPTFKNNRAIFVALLKNDACEFVWSWMMVVEIMLCDQFFSISPQSFSKSSNLQWWGGLAFNTIVLSPIYKKHRAILINIPKKDACEFVF